MQRRDIQDGNRRWILRRELELCYGLGGRRGLYEEESFQGKFSQRTLSIRIKFPPREMEDEGMIGGEVLWRERGERKIRGYRYLGQRRGERFSAWSVMQPWFDDNHEKKRIAKLDSMSISGSRNQSVLQ